MIELSPDRIAAEAGAEIVASGGEGRPERGVIDSRQVTSGDLFFGLTGGRSDGGEYAAGALRDGAWGVVVEPARAQQLAAGSGDGWVFSSPDPLASLQSLARAWRRQLGRPVVGITGSTGKTSAKDITRALVAPRVHASIENFNTEIGLPLTILAAPPETEVIVVEMAMRGLGQIAELCEIAEPDVGAITNVGPVHLELLGTMEAIAEAKAEILGGIRPGGKAVIPADAGALAPHLGGELDALTFGPGGDVFARSVSRSGRSTTALVVTPEGEQEFTFAFDEAHNLTNALTAIAIGLALGSGLEQMARRTPDIVFSSLRGEVIELPGRIVLVNDSYNANPTSMRAALEHLATLDAPRKLAVLGTMGELGPDADGFHREIGAFARSLGIGPLIGVGDLARAYAPDEWAPDPESAVDLAEPLLREGDAILVKGSRAVGLERFTDELRARRGPQARPAVDPKAPGREAEDVTGFGSEKGRS